MGRKDKLKARLFSRPKDFTWSELQSLLNYYSFEMINGKGSRRKFVHTTTKILINLHEPHPEKVLKLYAVDQVIEKLIELGDDHE